MIAQDRGSEREGLGESPGEETGPGLRIPSGVLAAIESALNGYLALDPEGARGFAPVYGRIVAIQVLGVDAWVTLIPSPGRIQVFGQYDAPADCVIRGTPLALARLASTERKDEELREGDVRIEGDSSVAHELAKAMAGLDVDWEEQLARVLGDPIAHRIGEGVRAVRNWGRGASDTLTNDLREYLQEEGRVLPTRYEVEAFLADVDTLRDDMERLAARIARLTRDLASRGSAPAEGASRAGPETEPETEPVEAAPPSPVEIVPPEGPIESATGRRSAQSPAPEPEGPAAPAKPSAPKEAAPASSRAKTASPAAKPKTARSKATPRKAPTPKTGNSPSRGGKRGPGGSA